MWVYRWVERGWLRRRCRCQCNGRWDRCIRRDWCICGDRGVSVGKEGVIVGRIGVGLALGKIIVGVVLGCICVGVAVRLWSRSYLVDLGVELGMMGMTSGT